MMYSPCSHFAEVSLGLKGVGCQSSKHSTGQEQGLQHSGVFIEGHCGEKTLQLEQSANRLKDCKLTDFFKK